MITVGVDLAAEPKRTAATTIKWDHNRATVLSLTMGVSDSMIIDLARTADKVGIDCPFGWPDDFVSFVSGHAHGTPLELPAGENIEWRRRLAYPATDRAVKKRTGRWPLSVSTDRLGLTAMRCATLLATLADAGIPVDRAGWGKIVEVYPAAALRCWQFSPAGYKTNAETRSTLLDALLNAMPLLELGEHEPLARASDDALDALISAVVARSSALGSCDSVPSGLAEQAGREGWIAVPAYAIERSIAQT